MKKVNNRFDRVNIILNVRHFPPKYVDCTTHLQTGVNTHALMNLEPGLGHYRIPHEMVSTAPLTATGTQV